MNSTFKIIITMAAAPVMALATTLTMTACGHSSSNTAAVAPSNYYVGTQSLLANYDYQTQLQDVQEKNVHQLMHQACGDQCENFSEDAIVDFILPNGASQAQLTISFPSRVGGAAAVVQFNVTLEPNQPGEALKFRSVDLSGRLRNGILTLSSRDGLIGTAQIASL